MNKPNDVLNIAGEIWGELDIPERDEIMRVVLKNPKQKIVFIDFCSGPAVPWSRLRKKSQFAILRYFQKREIM